MRPKSAMLLVLALGCGLVASVATSRYLSSSRPVKQEAGVPVVVAKADIPEGATIREDMVKLVRLPAQWVPRGAFQKAQEVAGRALRQPLFAGEPVIEPKLADKGADGGLPTMIPKEMRAVTVKVNEVSGVAGFIKPGNYVDVLSNFQRGEVGATMCRIVLQRVKVLAVDQTYRSEEGQPAAVVVKAVTLLVTPKQAEALSLAASQGTLQLAMRSNVDETEIKTSGITLQQVAGGEVSGKEPSADSPPAPAQPPPAEVKPDARTRLVDFLNKLKQNKEPAEPTAAAEPQPQPETTPAPPKVHVVEIIRGSEVTQQQFTLEESSAETKPEASATES